MPRIPDLMAIVPSFEVQHATISAIFRATVNLTGSGAELYVFNMLLYPSSLHAGLQSAEGGWNQLSWRLVGI